MARQRISAPVQRIVEIAIASSAIPDTIWPLTGDKLVGKEAVGHPQFLCSTEACI